MFEDRVDCLFSLPCSKRPWVYYTKNMKLHVILSLIITGGMWVVVKLYDVTTEEHNRQQYKVQNFVKKFNRMISIKTTVGAFVACVLSGDFSG